MCIALLVVVTGCSATSEGGSEDPGPPAPSLPLDFHRGHYERRFEVSAFTPCGSDEAWWVGEGPAEPWTELERGAARALGDSLAMYRGARLYVELRGDTTGRGAYGHLGAYPRELTLRSVSVVQRRRSSDCR